MRIRTLVGGVLALAQPFVARAQKPTVLVIGTGGTIGSAGGYWVGNASRVPIDSLVKISGIDSVAVVQSEQYLNVGSSSIGPERWLELSRKITNILKSRADLAGIVITHGTDTMEETAYFLDLTLGNDRPVVVTGSMRPADMAGADGPANLTSAIRVAINPGAKGRGTLVVMDDRAFLARDVTKTNSTRVETFQAPDRGPLAIVDPEGIFYRQKSPMRTTPQFDVTNVSELPRVDIVYAYPGADSVAVDALVAAGARGIVVAGVGRGGASPAQGAALRRAQQKGVVIVMSTRTGSGRVPIGERGNIGAGDLNPQKARVLLALALTHTTDPAQLRTIFEQNQ